MLQLIERFNGARGTRLAWLHQGIAQEMYHRGQLTFVRASDGPRSGPDQADPRRGLGGNHPTLSFGALAWIAVSSQTNFPKVQIVSGRPRPCWPSAFQPPLASAVAATHGVGDEEAEHFAPLLRWQ